VEALTGEDDGSCAAILAAEEPELECPAGQACAVDECDLLQGQACTNGLDCLSGFCVDGFCCNTVCNTACRACSALLSVGANGVCSNLKPNTKDNSPMNICNGAMACSAAGTCLKDKGQTCTLGNECASGFCADGFCCDTLCNGLCFACSDALTASANGTCDEVDAGLNSAAMECASGCCDGDGCGMDNCLAGQVCDNNADCAVDCVLGACN
jgi:hypothetical protein